MSSRVHENTVPYFLNGFVTFKLQVSTGDGSQLALLVRSY